MREEPGIRLGISGKGLLHGGRDLIITINGMDITTSLQHVELRMGIGELNTATLTMLVKEISVDADARLLLEARLNAKTLVVEEA